MVAGALSVGAADMMSDLDEEDISIVRAANLAFDIGTVQSMLTDAAIARAALTFISLDLIVQECARRGHQVCLHTICRLRRDALPVGYPPLADDDLPFNAERDL